MAIDRNRPPHPATTIQRQALDPHPATVTRAPPPHPATIQRRAMPHAATLDRRQIPHPAKEAILPSRALQRSSAEPIPSKAEESTEDDNAPKTKKKKKVAKKVVSKEQPPIVVIEDFNLAIQGDEDFLKLVTGLIKELLKVKVGAALLGEFANAPSATEWEKKKVTVAVLQRSLTTTDQPIRTGSFNAWNKDRSRAFGDAVPLINFPGIGMTFPKAGSLTTAVVDDVPVIQKHVDFPGGAPMVVALFHELCHAYYWQTGATTALQALNKAPDEGLFKLCMTKDNQVDAKENTEEQIVSGLLAGKGMRYSENSFRADAGLPARTGYRAPTVAIVDQELLEDKDWPKSWGTYKTSVSAVLDANGYKDLAKKF